MCQGLVEAEFKTNSFWVANGSLLKGLLNLFLTRTQNHQSHIHGENILQDLHEEIESFLFVQAGDHAKQRTILE